MTNIENGSYEVELSLEGGSGRATVESPTTLTVQDEEVTLEVIWSSPNYDYMIVDGETYYPVNTTGNSTFEIPVLKINEPFTVIGDTVAMSQPHEIEYQLTVNYQENNSNVAYLQYVVLIAVAIVAGIVVKKLRGKN